MSSDARTPKRSGVLAESEPSRLETILKQYAGKIPTIALARLFGISQTLVRRTMSKLEISLEPYAARKLRYDFESRDSLAEFDQLTLAERKTLLEVIEQLRLDREDSLVENAKKQLRKLLEEMRSARGPARKAHTACKGSCGEAWPRTSEFWHRAKSNKDGLKLQCRYCSALNNKVAQLEGRRGITRPGKRKITRLNGAERKQAIAFIKANASTVPGSFLAELFGVSDDTVTALRKEACVVGDAEMSRDLYHYWLYSTRMPPCTTSSEEQREALRGIWKRAKEAHQGHAAKADAALKRRLEALTRTEQLQTPDCEMRACRTCGAQYALIAKCFKPVRRGGPLSRNCDLCRRQDLRRKREERAKKQFRKKRRAAETRRAKKASGKRRKSSGS